MTTRIVSLLLSISGLLGTGTLLVFLPIHGAGALAVIAAAGCVIAGGLAFMRPGGGWRWGLWATSAFSAYFLFVAVAYVRMGQPDWHPLFAMGVTVLTASAAAGLISRVRAGGKAVSR